MVGLPDPLIVLLKVHRKAQAAERAAARQLWHEEGWVFATPDGRPLNPFTDYREWKALSREPDYPNAACTTPGTPPQPCSKGAELHQMQHSAPGVRTAP